MEQGLTARNPGRIQLDQTSDPAPLHVFVLHGNDTANAIRAARSLASGLNAELTLLAVIEVPLPLELDEPPVSIAFQESRLRELLSRDDASGRVDLVLCRDRQSATCGALPPDSIVVLGGRKRRFGSMRKLAQTLSSHGHRVFFAGEVKLS